MCRATKFTTDKITDIFFIFETSMIFIIVTNGINPTAYMFTAKARYLFILQRILKTTARNMRKIFRRIRKSYKTNVPTALFSRIKFRKQTPRPSVLIGLTAIGTLTTRYKSVFHASVRVGFHLQIICTHIKYRCTPQESA